MYNINNAIKPRRKDRRNERIFRETNPTGALCPSNLPLEYSSNNLAVISTRASADGVVVELCPQKENDIYVSDNKSVCVVILCLGVARFADCDQL